MDASNRTGIPREEQQALTAELFGAASFGFKATIVPVLGKLTKCSYLLCLCVCILSAVCLCYPQCFRQHSQGRHHPDTDQRSVGHTHGQAPGVC